jgi:hypothetical protein
VVVLITCLKFNKRRTVMPLGITWYTLDEAAAKYSLEPALILQWAEEGVVRSEQGDNQVMRVNVDDLELKVQERTRV